jgi:hypothetical protein
LPVITTVNPVGLVKYIDRWPRDGVAETLQVRSASRAGGSVVPSLVIRWTNAAATALVSSSEASDPSGVMKPRCQVTVPAPFAPPTVSSELTGCQEPGRPTGATAG